MKFEWDEQKAETNLRKHAVSFDEAITVFQDPMYVILADPDHSADENRFLALGNSDRPRLLIVSFTERRSAARIISARRATRRERKKYEEEDF